MPPQYKTSPESPPLSPPKLEAALNEQVKYLSEQIVRMQRSIDYLERERNRMRHDMDVLKAAISER